MQGALHTLTQDHIGAMRTLLNYSEHREKWQDNLGGLSPPASPTEMRGVMSNTRYKGRLIGSWRLNYLLSLEAGSTNPDYNWMLLDAS